MLQLPFVILHRGLLVVEGDPRKLALGLGHLHDAIKVSHSDIPFTEAFIRV